MSDRRRCTATNERGLPCGAAALRERFWCRMHDPELAEEVAAARRLGGVRRKRETTIARAFDIDEVVTYEGLRRLLSIAAFDLLQLDNGIARINAIIRLVSAACRLLERDHEERIRAIERRLGPWPPTWSTEPGLLDRDLEGDSDEDA